MASAFQTWDNPMGTDGFEFIEFAAPDPAAMGALFVQMGFTAVAKHRSKNVLLYKQGDINFILNAEPGSFAQSFARVHGPSICAIAFRVKDAAFAYKRAVEQGAWGVDMHPGPMELNIPAIKGIGDSLLYFVDRYDGNSVHGGNNVTIYDIDFVPIAGVDRMPEGAGLTYLDHLTHNVHRGRMDEWAGFYERLFNFKEVRYFDIEGRLTGLKSKAMTSPCGKIRIPINESSDDKSQIQEYLHAYHGEGIQHVAFGAADIYTAVESLSKKAVPFQTTPATYYEQLPTRIPNHGEDVARLQALNILVDGAPEDSGMLLQIFTQNLIGPIFFEIIQRKGNQGFGEGNFKALFESIELDQIRRGVLAA